MQAHSVQDKLTVSSMIESKTSSDDNTITDLCSENSKLRAQLAEAKEKKDTTLRGLYS